jgi:ABC-2 type transport system ATP-binding protein
MAQALAVETHGLTKRYSTGIVAVNNLDLRVRTGEVFGFLGSNGAGKTTTLRLLCGLLHPTSGTARVAGAVPGSPASLAHLGALVETAAFYPYLSGVDNLRVMARYASVGRARIDAVLKQVDLADRARHKFRTFSTGMKQRLGVASALLKDPDLLILDEPTSGLDPQGTVEMRALIRDIRREGRTVLLSSHLLNEVELTCDRVGVIAEGKLVAEGTVDELRARGGRSLRVRAAPLEQAQRLLVSILKPEQVKVTDGTFVLTVDPAQGAWINRKLVSDGIEVSELRIDEESLEDVFLQLTESGPKAPTLPSPASGGGDQRDSPASGGGDQRDSPASGGGDRRSGST